MRDELPRRRRPGASTALLALSLLAATAARAAGQTVTVTLPAAQAAAVPDSVIPPGAAPRAADATTLAGHWEGAFSREGSVQLCALDVGAAADSAASGADARATLDIPELGMFDEPLDSLALDASADVIVRLRCVYGEFVGRLHAEAGEITALNDGWGPPVRLHLKRASRPPAVVARRDVSFASAGLRLAGTLLLPTGALAAARVPGIVLMHGSDIGDRGAWEYRGLGELLARQGLAVLLYDRRGSGASEGSADSASFEDLAADALAAREVLAHQPEVRADRTGLLGASQSGWIAPLAAVKSADVAFLVLLSAPGVGVFEQELQRVEGAARSLETEDGPLPEQEVVAALDYTRALLAACRASTSSADPGADQGSDSGDDDEADRGAEREAAFAALAPLSTQARAAAWAECVQIPESAADLAWFAAHDFDPGATLARVACPVLAFYGELDATVPPAANAPLLRAALERNADARVTLKLWPGCGHDLERRRALLGDDWAWPEHVWLWARKPPGLIEELAAWVAAL